MMAGIFEKSEGTKPFLVKKRWLPPLNDLRTVFLPKSKKIFLSGLSNRLIAAMYTRFDGTKLVHY